MKYENFIDWEVENRPLIKEDYYKYLKETVLEDDNFDITTTEDYWTWAEEEYDMSMEAKGDK